ncbi:hypothetical protein C8Q78DRAFT_1006688 [Trametes maxima]|nr:hypothetical protein C8Q78DRAFT_1006688 [Trametes maxima]
MAAVEAFETALKDVVNSRRVSQSKMNVLTEAALKCMDVRGVLSISALTYTVAFRTPARACADPGCG